ncbi:acyltransferase family protein [Aquihabitans daechungensis]|uniref:acyltransferase family protein n=1 Tax=Aquihabitans daechungensis TaxID=1052257 RepID=UPI003B9FD6BA
MTTTTSAPPHPATKARARIGGLDGLRAIAVVGVMLYHADVTWFHGGFIGVDIFFVLSGYLVTTIVMDGLEKRGGLGFRRFWGARFRRLEPAQITMMVVVTLVVAIGFRDLLSTLRAQVIAGLSGTMNWYLIVANSSYFEQAARAPLFRHLWSLAIELQFYLVWPLLLIVLAKRFHDRVSVVIAGLAVAILGSAVYMAILYQPGADPSRPYFDTFSRLQAPLMGALLAMLWRPRSLRRAPAGAHGRQVTAVAAGSLVLLVWMMHVVDDRGAFMYRGGFLLTALLSALVVAGLVHPNGALGGRWALGSSVMVAIGLRSYGLYLWHWPVFVLLRPRIDTDWSWGTVFVVRMILTIGLTEICYRLVERPWHTRARDASFAGIKRRLFQPSGVRPAPRLLALGSAFACLFALIIVVVPHEADTVIVDSLTEGEAALANQPGGTVPSGSTGTTTVEDDVGSVSPTTTLVTSTEVDGPVTLVGDSVMVGASPTVLAEFPGRANVDAKVSRQAADIPPALEALKANDVLAPTVVVQVGINGTVTEENLRDIVAAVEGRRIFVINARVPRSWEAGNNALVKRLVPKLPNATVIDWYAKSDGHRDWFLDDGVHLTEEGRQAYADLIHAAVDKKAEKDGG